VALLLAGPEQMTVAELSAATCTHRDALGALAALCFPANGDSPRHIARLVEAQAAVAACRVLRCAIEAHRRVHPDSVGGSANNVRRATGAQSRPWALRTLSFMLQGHIIMQHDGRAPAAPADNALTQMLEGGGACALVTEAMLLEAERGGGGGEDTACALMHGAVIVQLLVMTGDGAARRRLREARVLQAVQAGMAAAPNVSDLEAAVAAGMTEALAKALRALHIAGIDE
jgi:hypothetical protein